MTHNTQPEAPAAGIGAIRKLWRLTPKVQRRQAPVLVLLLIFGTAFEVLGIGLLVPLVNLLANDNVAPSNSVLEPIFRVFGARTQLQMLTVGFTSIGAVMLLKNLYLVGVTHFQNWHMSKIRTSIETRMFERYIRADYNFHLGVNSSTLSRNLITETDQVIGGVLLPTFIFATEALTVAGIATLLLYIEPLGSLALFAFFGVCGITYMRVVSPLISRFGLQRSDLRGKAFRIISETLAGIKPIKVVGRESFFLHRFVLNSEQSVRLAARTDTVQRLPALLIELWGVLGLLVVVFSMLLQGRGATAVLSSLGLFVGASFRFVPSLNRLLIAWQTMKLARPAINVVYGEIEAANVISYVRTPIQLKEELCVRGLSFAYDQQSAAVLNDVTLSLRRGESLGIIGMSGVGKTTLVDLLLGLLSPTSGEISVDGIKIDPEHWSWQSTVGYVPQEIFLADETIRNNIAFGIEPDDISEAKLLKCLMTAQLMEFVQSLPAGLDTETGERGVRLSGGQRQRIGIARALYHEPSLLILDEATSALDLETESELVETLEAIHKEITMIVVSHRFSTLKYCDRIIRLDKGTLSEIGGD